MKKDDGREERVTADETDALPPRLREAVLSMKRRVMEIEAELKELGLEIGVVSLSGDTSKEDPICRVHLFAVFADTGLSTNPDRCRAIMEAAGREHVLESDPASSVVISVFGFFKKVVDHLHKN